MTVWKILTLPCVEAARLASDGMDRDLKWVERAALHGHLLSCRSCRRFRRQLRVIEDAARAASTPMPQDARDRIAEVLDKEG